jgi:hypothetical protein
MLRAVRILLQAVLFFLLLGVVIAIGSAETGVVEKLAIAAFGALLVWVAVQVRHLGEPHGPRST